jgi:hypothetical protein
MSARASSGSRNTERLAARRRARRRRALVVLVILILVLIGAALYGLRQSAVRVSHIAVFGADPSLATYATDAMQGFYFGIIPRDSIFFLPEGQIRSDILAANSDIAAVSIFRSSLNSISINVDMRTGVARWCGTAPTPNVPASCYLFDPNGVIYAPFASTTETLNPFMLYAPLAGSTTQPLGATIADAADLPSTFDFARQLATLGSAVTAVDIHDGQVDDYLASGTRISYVLGDEQNAYTALVSAQTDFSLTDGSVEYVDLRFDGKVYLKKKE